MFKFFLKLKAKDKKMDLSFLGKRTPIWKPLLFLLPSLAIIILITIVPFITTFSKALHPLADSHKVASASFGLQNFSQVFQDSYFQKSLSNSLLYAIISIPVSMALSLVISAAVASIINKRVRKNAQTLFFLPYVTSIVAVSLAFAYLLSSSGLFNKIFGISTPWLTNTDQSSYDSLVAMLIQGVWSALAFQILIFTTAILSVDKDRYKAASIDGAGPVKQFFTITLPSIRRTISFIVTVGLIGAVKVFPLALFDNSASNAQAYGGSTLMLFVYKNVTEGHYGVASAAAIILVVIGIAFNVVMKNFIRGVSFAFLKGGELRVQNKINSSKSLFKQKNL